jgi:hypothetical protein
MVRESFAKYKIYWIIKSHPGITLKQLHLNTSKSNATLSEQINKLLLDELIYYVKEKRFKKLYVKQDINCPCCGEVIKQIFCEEKIKAK